MKRIRLSGWSIAALTLAVSGVVVGAAAMVNADPFLGLFSITVVCAGGVSALVGMQGS